LTGDPEWWVGVGLAKIHKTGGVTVTRRLRTPAAIVLDLDGTVLDSSSLPDAAAQACALVCGTLEGLDPEQLFAANKEAWAQVWREVELACWLGEVDGLAASREAWRRTLEVCGCDDASVVELAFTNHCRLAREAFRMYPDFRGFLDCPTERGLSLGLVTNGPSDLQRGKIDALDLSRSISAIVISGEHGVAKPDPAIFRVALDALGVDPGDAWFVGDSLDTDVAGALSAGMVALWLNRGGPSRLGFGVGAELPLAESTVVPHAELESMSELIQLLRDR
jgi:putative hydrolase of the HAD superfamily